MLYLYIMAFNRDRNSRSGGDRRGFRPRFGDSPRFAGGAGRGDRGPVEMHSAVCDNCGKECEVPFRPTSGKPIYCNDCFGNQRGSSGSRRPERRNFERSPDERSSPALQDKLTEINAKLDNILKLLEEKKPEKKIRAKKPAPAEEE